MIAFFNRFYIGLVLWHRGAVKILPHYTYADYVQWEGKWEVIDGIPYAMSPAPIPRHQFVAGNLHTEFRLQLNTCDRCIVYQSIDYLADDDTILQPDILIVCSEITKKYLDFAPVLIPKVLSPSTADKDRHYKYEIYQSKGVKYYLLIDSGKNEAEIYELQNEAYQLAQKGKYFQFHFCLDDRNAEIDFSQIW